MSKIAKFIFVVIFCIGIAPVAISEYKLFGGDNDGGQWYVDFDSIEYNGKRIKYWSRLNHDAKTAQYLNMKSTTYYTEADCNEFKANVIQTINHKGLDGSGRGSIHKSKNDWIYLPPSSFTYKLLQHICKLR